FYRTVCMMLVKSLGAIRDYAASDIIVGKDLAGSVIAQIIHAMEASKTMYTQAVQRAYMVEDRNFLLYFNAGKFTRILTFGLCGRKQTSRASELSFGDSQRFITQAMDDARTVFQQTVGATLKSLEAICRTRQDARQLLERLVGLCLPGEQAQFLMNEAKSQ